MSRGIKALARELDIPVIAISQLNRAPEQRDRGTPRMSDLRESGAIEQDADVVLLLHREHVYNEQVPKEQAELIIAKQRNGPTGKINLNWYAESMRFGVASEAPEPAEPTYRQNIYSTEAPY